MARILKDHGFSLRGNVKTLEGKQHPDRDGQFRYINSQVATFGDSGEPVISVDTKKKELVGNYKAGGREYRPTGEPVAVDTDAAYRKSPVLLIESPHPGGVAG